MLLNCESRTGYGATGFGDGVSPRSIKLSTAMPPEATGGYGAAIVAWTPGIGICKEHMSWLTTQDDLSYTSASSDSQIQKEAKIKMSE